MGRQIHPTAVIHPTAEIGEDVIIGPYVIIEEAVVIGDGCRIDGLASIQAFTRMGKRNHVFAQAHVGGEPQDLKFHGEETWLEIGDENRFREFCTVHRGTEGGGGRTTIGSNNLFMAYTHVAHDCRIGSHVIMSNCATLAGHIEVGDYAILGGLSAVHQFCRIGTSAFLGGTSSVSQDIPPYMLAVGNRGGIHSPNLVGLRRRQASARAIAGLKKAFRLIWHSDTPRKEALEMLLDEYGDCQEVRNFVEFVETSQRGIAPAAQEDCQE